MSAEKKVLFRELIKAGGLKTVDDLDLLVKELYKETLEGMLEAELDQELGYSRYDHRNKQTTNSRNGKRAKKVRSSVGDVELAVPRDREGTFEPQVVPKGSRDISRIEQQILALYSRGLSTRDIQAQVQEFYGVALSADTVSGITDKLLPVIESWQNRALDPLYPLVWLDGFVLKIRTEGRVVNRCAHVVLGLTLEGYKEVLGIWIGDGESSRFWLGVLTELRNRGVQDILLATVDGLTGFEDAITTVYPQTDVQRCLVHQVRASCRFVSDKERKGLCADLKKIYTAASEAAGRAELERFSEKWQKRYPHAVKSWQVNWEALSQHYRFSPEIRKLMYTTNPIESLNRQFRKVVKTKSQFPTEQAAMKLLYLSVQRVSEKWTMRVANWGQIVGQFSILYGDRFTQYL